MSEELNRDRPPNSPASPPKVPREDPLVTNARREALVVLAAWVVALIWTVGYCLKFGYDREPQSLTLVMGVPDWIFWGILTPWGACYLFAAWFSLVFMHDAELGVDRTDGEDE